MVINQMVNARGRGKARARDTAHEEHSPRGGGAHRQSSSAVGAATCGLATCFPPRDAVGRTMGAVRASWPS